MVAEGRTEMKQETQERNQTDAAQIAQSQNAKQKKIVALSDLLGKVKDGNVLTAQLIKKQIEKIEEKA